MEVLRVRIRQPEAHYGMPFSQVRKLTYPIPPFSTIKGLAANLLGTKREDEKEFVDFMSGISMCIHGRYESLLDDYVWYRNTLESKHTSLYHESTNRILNGTVGHPGGQIPVYVATLQNVELVIYFAHVNSGFLQIVESRFRNTSSRRSPLCLGRSEDWLIFDDITVVELIEQNDYDMVKTPYYTWIPAPDFLANIPPVSDYESFYRKTEGTAFRLPTYYEIREGQRIFTKYVTVKLYEQGFMEGFGIPMDASLGIPVLLTHMNMNKERGDGANTGKE